MKFGKIKITQNNKTFIIAEIGINHEGSYKKCIEMVNMAKKSGADAIKLQIVNIEESYAKGTSSYKVFNKKNLKFFELIKIKKYCKMKKIYFFATPGDFSSLERIFKLKLPVIKFSSGLMNNYPLIFECVKKALPIIISTGLADESDLKKLKNFLIKIKAKNFSILKCTSEYPAKRKNLNLKKINYLKDLFRCTIGYSDHYNGYAASLLAVMNGAKIIEKHFTLNKNLKGSDHHISLEPNEFSNMVSIIREIDEINFNESNEKKFISHKPNKKLFRKLITIKDIKKGDKISFKNIGFKRLKKTEKSLDPKYFFLIKNKISNLNIKKNLIITKKLIKEFNK